MKNVIYTTLLLAGMAAALTACDKYGAGGYIARSFGNWSEVKLPDGCKATAIAAEEHSGVVVLCADGRLFH